MEWPSGEWRVTAAAWGQCGFLLSFPLASLTMPPAGALSGSNAQGRRIAKGASIV